MGKFGGREVKSGGRFTQKSKGAAPKGKPSIAAPKGRGEFAVSTAGDVASGLGKGRAEFATERAGGK